MRKIAVLGSRAWYDQQAVVSWIDTRYAVEGEFIIVSGGAKGACSAAEFQAQKMGLPVISIRPVTLQPFGHDPQYGVDEWRFYRGAGKIIPHYEPTWADWHSAAHYRSILIAERADEAVIFWDGHSPGSSFEIDLFRSADKPYEVIRAEAKQG